MPKGNEIKRVYAGPGSDGLIRKIDVFDVLTQTTSGPTFADIWQSIRCLPVVKPELTYEQVAEYCDKYCFVILSHKLFREALTRYGCEAKWIKFEKRALTEEEQKEFPNWTYIIDCPLPDDGEDILVSDGHHVWLDTFYMDDGCYLDSDRDIEDCAWMPLPEPYKEIKNGDIHQGS